MLRTGRLEGVTWCCCWTVPAAFSPQTLAPPESLLSTDKTSAFLRPPASPGALLSEADVECEVELEEVGKGLRGLPVVIAEEASVCVQ